jgi:hypothetical protein
MPGMSGFPPCWERCCDCPAVAAYSNGLTCEPPWGPSCGWGVFAPVPMGVDMFEGISDVNIVADEGEMRYLVCRVWRSASLKPVHCQQGSSKRGYS